MEPAISITEHVEFLRRLGSSLPASLERYAGGDVSGTGPTAHSIALRFTYRDVPFFATIERDGGLATLRLIGAIGPLPFSVQAAQRRRRALTTLAAAGGTALNWRVSTRQEITVEGTITLGDKPTPAAMVTGAVQLLLQGDRYLSLLLDILGDADNLNSPDFNAPVLTVKRAA
jgi:hypothetical protein